MHVQSVHAQILKKKYPEKSFKAIWDLYANVLVFSFGFFFFKSYQSIYHLDYAVSDKSGQ